MIIFQTAGSSLTSGFRFDAHLLGDLSSQATTFRDNDYIHRLNRTLQAEMRAVAAYRSIARHLPEKLAIGLELHERSARSLVNLIIANRGIPEDRSALSFGLTRRFIQICARVPGRLTDLATVSTLHKLETHLIECYNKLLTLAPSRDLQALTQLLLHVERQEAALSDPS